MRGGLCWTLGLAMTLSAVPWFCGGLQAEEASSLRLVPFPKEVKIQTGRFALDRPLVLTTASEQAKLLGEMIAGELKRAGVAAPKVQTVAPTGEAEKNALVLSTAGAKGLGETHARAGATPEDYVLQVHADGVRIQGQGPAGLFYGVASLCQLIRANRQGTNLPCLTIRDWPSIRWRAYQDDLTRGPSSTLDTLQREVRLGAGLKMNVFTYYMEHQYAFSKHPVIGPAGGSLLPEELKALVAYAQPWHVDILGNQQSFGHFYHILKHNEYAALSENASKWVVSPVNEDSYRLLDDMYSEVIPLLPFPFFNVCCDETGGLGTGASKPLADKIGVGGVYARHLRRLHDLLKDKYGKRMMMWGDIILHHPENLKEIPTDTIMLTWGYHAEDSFENQIIPFAKSGYEFFVCPGVNNWNRILPDFNEASINIRNFVRDGAKHGAIGVLNTTWDDDGESLNAPNWHGLAWGAECSWNAASTPPEAFNRRIGAVLFGEQADHFGLAIELLAKTHSLEGMERMMDKRFWTLDLQPDAAGADARRRQADQLLGIVRPAIEQLKACQHQATVNTDLLDYLIFGARRMELVGQRMLDWLEAAEAYRAACKLPVAEAGPLVAKAESLVRKTGEAHKALIQEYERLWLAENRPYFLDHVTARYQKAADTYRELAERLAAAANEAKAGKPLPKLEEILPGAKASSPS